MSFYLDSSAILKLIFQESESKSLIKALGTSPVTSMLARIEISRVIQRTNPANLPESRKVLSTFNLIPINEAVIRIAENFTEAPHLRSLDAIHVASALLVQNSIEGLITYDARMAVVAKEYGIKVFQPL